MIAKPFLHPYVNVELDVSEREGKGGREREGGRQAERTCSSEENLSKRLG